MNPCRVETRPTLPNSSRSRCARIRRAHQALADQEGVHAVGAHRCHVLGRADAALGHHDTVGRDAIEQRVGGVQRDLEAVQVAVVDPDQPPGYRERHLELGGVVHLDQHVQAELGRQRRQVRHVRGRVGKGRGDQQDAVGTQRARLHDLVGIDGEILAQHRQRDRGARRLQVRIRPLEEIDVGQHRKAGRAALLVGSRQRGRIEIGPDQALAGRGLLDLGDHRVAPGGDARGQRIGKAAHRRGVTRHGAQLREAARAAALGDFLVLALQDPQQDRRLAHSLSRHAQKLASASMRSSARPVWIMSSASSTPRRTESVMPLT